MCTKKLAIVSKAGEIKRIWKRKDKQLKRHKFQKYKSNIDKQGTNKIHTSIKIQKRSTKKSEKNLARMRNSFNK